MLCNETSQAKVLQGWVKSSVSSLVHIPISKCLRGWPARLFHSRLSFTLKAGGRYSLEFDIKHAGIAGLAWNFDTLIKRKWNSSTTWNPVSAKEDLTLCQKHVAVGSTSHALGLDPSKLPAELDPTHQHVQAADPHDQHVDHQQAMMALIMGDEPPFALPKSKQQARPPSGLLSRPAFRIIITCSICS